MSSIPNNNILSGAAGLGQIYGPATSPSLFPDGSTQIATFTVVRVENGFVVRVQLAGGATKAFIAETLNDVTEKAIACMVAARLAQS